MDRVAIDLLDKMTRYQRMAGKARQESLACKMTTGTHATKRYADYERHSMTASKYEARLRLHLGQSVDDLRDWLRLECNVPADQTETWIASK